MDALVSATLVAQTFPAGTTPGNVVAQLLAADGTTVVATQSVPADPAATAATLTFASVAAGTYSVSVQRQDGGGNTLGPVITSTAFTITTPQTVSITVASGVAVTVQ